jgi:hypothetical protein
MPRHSPPRDGAGIETIIFRADADRTDFVAHLTTVGETGAWTVYTRALLPTHAHLLMRASRFPVRPSCRAKAATQNVNGAMISGESFAGLFTRVPMGNATMSSAGYGRRSACSGATS